MMMGAMEATVREDKRGMMGVMEVMMLNLVELFGLRSENETKVHVWVCLWEHFNQGMKGNE